MKVNANYTITQNSFRGGLTPQIAREIKNTKPIILEKEFAKYGVVCDFKNSKTISSGFAYAINICQEAFQKYNLPFHFLPPSIKVLDKDEWVDLEDKKCFGLCTWDSMSIEKNKELSQIGSIYVNSLAKDNVNVFDKQADLLYEQQILSTDHFLGRFLHELLHNIHLNLVFEKEIFIKDYNSEKHMVDLVNNKISDIKKFIIKNNIGKYASEGYPELFSEVLVRMITDSLKPNSLELKNNPLDKLKEYPKFVQKFINSEMELF